MKRTICRLSLADKYFGGGGGGGGGDITMRNPKAERKDIQRFNMWDFIGPNSQLNQFSEGQPLLQTAETGALDFWKQLPDMLGRMRGYESDLGGYRSDLGGFSNQIGQQYTGLADQFRTLQPGLNQVSSIVGSGGALTGEGLRTSQQQARAAGSASGTTRDVGATVTEVLNNEANRQARFNTALQQQQGLVGQQAGLRQEAAGFLGQRAGITGQQAGITGQQAGMVTQQQGLQTGAINQLLGVERGKVGALSQLQNPILGYLGNLFSGNQQASIAGAQIGAQQQASNKAAKSSTAGGAVAALAAVATAY